MVQLNVDYIKFHCKRIGIEFHTNKKLMAINFQQTFAQPIDEILHGIRAINFSLFAFAFSRVEKKKENLFVFRD